MAEFVLTFAAEGVLTKVTKLVAEEFTLVLGFRADLAQLEASFVKVQAMLRDVERSQVRGEAVELWVKDLEDVAHKADDLLDEIGYEVLRRKVEIRDQMKRKVRNFFSRNNPVAFRFKMAHRIRSINTCLVNLNNEAAGRIGLVARALVNAAPQDVQVLGRETVSSFDSDEKLIIGREEVVSGIVQLLIKSNYTEEDHLPVLAIVGMPGLGKTTLAKSIYHNSEINKHFDEKIWVCVSTPFEVKTILKGILESLNPEKSSLQSKDAICKFIREKLEKKRYLLVLDDVWNEDAEKWKELASCLLSVNNNRGSNIISTTRSDKVAKVMESLPRCDLEKLSVEECWLIMKNKAILVGNAPITKEQEEIGKKIARKCGGVPLVAKVLGDVLRSKTSEQWGAIVDSEIWDSPEAENRIIKILKLSFDELTPPSLKLCFAYCSMFVKDFEMEKDDLIQLWMAQGWLHPYSDKSLEMEERGNEYFNILLGKSFFQDITKDYGGVVTKCKMHDLVHDLAKSVSKQENSSSLFSNGEDLDNFQLKYRSLRILNLYKTDITELPVSIGKLKHLRYLNVLKTKIKTFPKSIGQLYNLQTLKIPYELEEFPKEIANLINLRHIYFGRYMKVPSGILGRLTSLRSLPFIRVSNTAGPRIEELSGLNELHGALFIHALENVGDKEDAQKAMLEEKKHVRKLVLGWNQDRPNPNMENDTNVLEALRPHSSLEFLEIHEFMGSKLPSWLMEANKLKEIELLGCINCEELPVLGHLPNLSSVSIRSMKSLTRIGFEFYGDTYVKEARPLFPALKTLHIEKVDNLIEWMEAPKERANRVVFPSLENLIMIGCDRLTSAPSHFPSLKKLVIERMTNGGMPLGSILSNQLTTLTYLSLWYVGITCLPEGMLENNKNLAYLDIIGSSELTCISPGSQRLENCCQSLSFLRLWGCEKLKSLPDGILTPSLKYLELFFCSDLKYIPDATGIGLRSLETLVMQFCKVASVSFSQSLPSLSQLRVDSCWELSSLPDGLQYCTSIRSLEITRCPKLPPISNESLSTSLQKLCVNDMEALPISPRGFVSLLELKIDGFRGTQFGPEFEAFLQTLVSLQKLTILKCYGLESIPSSDKLTSLRSLEISCCDKLTYLPVGLAASSQPCSLTHLKELTLGPLCYELDTFPAFQAIPQLESLTINGWIKLTSLPEQIQHMSSLRRLKISYFPEMEAIPEWLGNLVSLDDLTIEFCQQLKYLPSVEAMKRLAKLKEICIVYCDILEERCKEESGQEWPKIRHIPFIKIQGWGGIIHIEN